MKPRSMKKIVASFAVTAAIIATSFFTGPMQTQAHQVENLEYGKTYSISGTGQLEDTIYRVKLVESGKLTLRTGNSTSYIGITIEDSMEDMVAYFDCRYETVQKEMYLNAGTYQIKVHPTESFKGVAGLMATFAPAGETYKESVLRNNNMASAATRIKPNGKIVGMFAINDSNDYYKVTLKKAGTFQIKVKNEFGKVNLSMYDTKQKIDWVQENISKREHTYKMTLPAGNYYLTVDNGNDADNTGVYRLTTRFAPVSSTRVKARSTAAGSLTVTAMKRRDVAGYEYMIATDRKFRKGRKFVEDRRNTKVFSGLRGKTRYFVRVRTYRCYKSGEKKVKVYSDWSRIKAVKVK